MNHIFTRRMRSSAAFAPQMPESPESAEHAIAELRWYPVREPVSGNRYTVLRAKTRSGLTGWGECAHAPEQDAKDLEREWVGRSATLYAAIDHSSPLAGALDMAMLDILGKATRAPIYRVLGGPTRHKVRAFTAANAAGFSAVGIAAPKPASRNQGKAYQMELQALLTKLPKDRDFVLSAQGTLTPGDAASVARAIESLHPLWFGRAVFRVRSRGAAQNLRRDCYAARVRTRNHGRSRLLGAPPRGTRRCRPPGYRAMGNHGRAPGRSAGGVVLRSHRHHDGGPVATAAALHLAASVPNFIIQHLPVPADPKDREMRAAIASGELETPRDGFLRLPSGPGLGIQVNEAALEKYHAA